jgi:hypothetical protein
MITIFEEPTNFSKPMWWELLDIVVVAILWIIGTDGYDLVVFLALAVISGESVRPDMKSRGKQCFQELHKS